MHHALYVVYLMMEKNLILIHLNGGLVKTYKFYDNSLYKVKGQKDVISVGMMRTVEKNL